MAKKCIPGVICIENMTLFILFVSFVIITYLVYSFHVKPRRHHIRQTTVLPSYSLNTQVMQPPMGSYPVVNTYPVVNNLATRSNIILDDYAPPFKNDGVYFPRELANMNQGQGMVIGQRPVGIPINIETRGIPTDYSQLGILTQSSGHKMILSLMGRKLMNGVDKWQYYTISENNSMNRLPIKVNGRSCSGEYGCDCLNSGDVVFVEGYDSTFRVTMYENNRFSYIPFL